MLRLILRGGLVVALTILGATRGGWAQAPTYDTGLPSPPGGNGSASRRGSWNRIEHPGQHAGARRIERPLGPQWRRGSDQRADRRDGSSRLLRGLHAVGGPWAERPAERDHGAGRAAHLHALVVRQSYAIPSGPADDGSRRWPDSRSGYRADDSEQPRPPALESYEIPQAHWPTSSTPGSARIPSFTLTVSLCPTVVIPATSLAARPSTT